MTTQTGTNQTGHMNTQQIFMLIDSILPFEVCLHYQVLPLAFIENTLELAVVDSEDKDALDYILKILAYRNCSVVIQAVSAAEQRSILSAYLCHTQQQKITTSQPSSKNAKSQSQDTQKPSPQQLSPLTSLNNTLKTLDIQANYLNHPLEALSTLPAQHLLQELLGRVLEKGIGRLYFERLATQGRVLWSQDGILQSILEDLEPTQFQNLINELKRFTGLTLIPLEHPKKVEIERIYQGTHLLLRLRFSPGKYGEEANLQVLRGAALKFYQQQKLSNLSQDALQLAQQLEKKLAEIGERVHLAPLPSDNLPLLNQLLQTIIQQAETLLQQNQEQK